jgi:3-hydroxyisobutyrate dehydrogenase-like beta-hydroxyacid dehydrogenase
MNAPSPASTRIGFIGLGAMGSGMAGCLAGAGYSLTVFDANPQARDVWQDRACVARSVRDVAANSDVVMLSLPGDDVTRSVCLNPETGLIGAWRDDMVLVDLGTSKPAVSVEIAHATEHAGGAMLDAPVSGGPGGAAHGTLSIMVGGAQDVYERMLPLLQVLGQDIAHVGPNGCGQAVKGANQLVMGLTNAVFMEAIAYAANYGVEPAIMADVLANAGAGRVSFTRMAQTVARGRAPYEDVKLLHLRRFVPDGVERGLRLPAAEAVLKAANAAPEADDPEGKCPPGWKPGPRPSYWQAVHSNLSNVDGP